MALDKLVDKIVTKKAGTIEASPKYDSRAYLTTTENVSKLEKADLQSEEGLKDYSGLTGENPRECSAKETEFRKRGQIEIGRISLFSYMNKHFKNIVRELDEDPKVNLALNYLLQNDTKGQKEYNEARKTSSKAMKELEEIEQDPKKYLKETLENESPLMAGYIVRYQKEFFGIRTKEVSETAILAVVNYGADKFLETTKRELELQKSKLSEIETTANKEIATKVEIAEIKNKRPLYATEIAKLTHNERKKVTDAQEEYSDSNMFPDFMREVSILAIQSISEKRKAKEVQAANDSSVTHLEEHLAQAA